MEESKDEVQKNDVTEEKPGAEHQKSENLQSSSCDPDVTIDMSTRTPLRDLDDSELVLLFEMLQNAVFSGREVKAAYELIAKFDHAISDRPGASRLMESRIAARERGR